MADRALTDAERKDLFRILGDLMASIHRLTTAQSRVVMGVDDHIRRNELSTDDLDKLREVAKALKASSAKK